MRPWESVERGGSAIRRRSLVKCCAWVRVSDWSQEGGDANFCFEAVVDEE